MKKKYIYSNSFLIVLTGFPRINVLWLCQLVCVAASIFSCFCAANFTWRRSIARRLFCIYERWSAAVVVVPVGTCNALTAVSVLLTC